MAWDITKPVTDGPLESAPIRENWEALDLRVVAPLTALALDQVLKVGAANALTGIAGGALGDVLTVTAGGPTWVAGMPGNPMTAVGDLIRGGASGAPTRLAATTDGSVLTLAAGVPTWTPGFQNPMSAVGDLVVGTTAGAPQRLPAVAIGSVFTSAGVGVTPTWSQNLRLGTGTLGASAARVIALGGGTAPTTSPIDTVQLWGADFAGAAESHGLEVRDERGGRYSLATWSDGTAYIRAWHAGGNVADLRASAAGPVIGTYQDLPVQFHQAGLSRLTLETSGNVSVAGQLDLASGVRYGSESGGYATIRTSGGWIQLQPGGTTTLSGSLALPDGVAFNSESSTAVIRAPNGFYWQVHNQGGLYTNATTLQLGNAWFSTPSNYARITANSGHWLQVKTDGWTETNTHFSIGGNQLNCGTIDASANLVSRGGLYVQGLTTTWAIPYAAPNGWFTSGGHFIFATNPTLLQLTAVGGVDLYGLRLAAQAIGGQQWTLIASGTGSGLGAQAFSIYNESLGRVGIRFLPGNVTHLSCGGQNARSVGTTGPDSAGPGFRYLTIQN
jgi:hypothetical protein